MADKLAAGALPAGVKTAADAARVMFNDRLDAAVAGFFMVSVIVILTDSLWGWVAVLRGTRATNNTEVPYTATAITAD